MRLGTARRDKSLPSHPSGLAGVARLDRSTKVLAQRIQPGDVAVIDHIDLDRVSAEALVRARVSAVVNASPSMSGRYPNLGPGILLAAGIPILDNVGQGVFANLKEGDRVRLDGPALCTDESNARVVATGEDLDEERLARATSKARAGLTVQFEAFAATTMEYLRRERESLLESVNIPPLRTRIEGRHVVLVVRGYDHDEDLASLHDYIREYRPVLVGVDGGADVLREAGYQPDLIVGDMDAVSSEALTSGAEIVVHAHPSGRTRGLDRVNQLGVQSVVFPSAGTSEDSAMLLIDEAGAALIVAVGSHATLLELLDKGREGMASTFLTRLRVGGALVDATAVSRLYRHRARKRSLFLLAVVAFVALAAGMVIGATALHRGLVHSLNGQVQGLTKDKETLRAEYVSAQRSADASASALKVVGSELTAGMLKGRTVTVVNLPGADQSSHDQAVAALTAAGASVVGTIVITGKAVDPQSSSLADDLAARLVPAGVSLPAGDASGRLAAVLAAALVEKALPTPATSTTFTRVITALQSAGFVAAQTGATASSAAVIIAGSPSAQGNSLAETFNLALTRSLRNAGAATVEVGSIGTTRNGGGIAAVRGDAPTAALVSTVDGIEDATGPLTLVGALLEQLRGGVGQYGTGPGATAVVPSIAMLAVR